MLRRTLWSYVVFALCICGLSLSALMADQTAEWKAVTISLQKYTTDIDSLKHHLVELKDHKSELLRLPVSNGEDRTTAAAGTTATVAQNGDTELDRLGTEIRDSENKLERSIKKKDFLFSFRAEIKDEDSLDSKTENVKDDLSETQKALAPVHARYDELMASCKECKLSLLASSRNPSSESSRLREFRGIVSQRNQLEDRLESLQLQLEVLQDVKTAAVAQESSGGLMTVPERAH